MNNEFKVINEWKVPSGIITAAVACPTQVTVSQGKTLYTFKIEKHGVVLLASTVLSDDVAFLSYESDENRVGTTVFVALWRSNIIHVSVQHTFLIRKLYLRSLS